MSEDEIFIVILCGIIAVMTWGKWFHTSFFVVPFRAQFRDRSPLIAGPIACAVALFFVLRRYASHDVKDDPIYLLFYMVMGAAWVGMAAKFYLPLLDLNARDDVAERHNPAAAIAIAGALLGITLAFAGGNIGDGPGWWVVVFSALISTATLVLGWLFLNVVTPVSDAITIDRDVPSGMRVSGFFIGSGLVVGRSVAGDWESVGATMADYMATVWPVFLFWLAAAMVEKILAPKPANVDRPSLIQGIGAASVYIVVGALFALLRGRW